MRKRNKFKVNKKKKIIKITIKLTVGINEIKDK